MKLKIFLGILVLLIIAGGAFIFGCGRDKIDSSGVTNTIAKKIGGVSTVKLPPGMKLVHVTWKTDPKTDKTSLYYLYRPMRPDEFPETYKYQEDSTWGVLESTIIIKEVAATAK